MRVLFMGTPWMAVPILRALHKEGHEILATVSQPDRPAGRRQVSSPTPVKTLALELGLPVVQPEKIRTDDFRRWIEGVAPEIIVVVAYGRILPGWLLAIPPRGCVNVHFSLLPKYRGAAPVNWALARGETETGVTTMMMDEGMDTGPILLQKATAIGPDESAPELAERLVQIGAPLLLETLTGLEREKILSKPQDHQLATMAPILKREDGQIDWRLASMEIRDRIRAFQPWPGAWTQWRGNRLLIWRATAQVGGGSGHPEPEGVPHGGVHVVDEKILNVRCGGGSELLVEELQLEGRKRVSASEFLNGHKFEPGERLGEQ